MGSWIREIAGWLLVVVALYVISIAVPMVTDLSRTPRIVEASVLVFAALGILRAGILLVRISAAARIGMRPPR